MDGPGEEGADGGADGPGAVDDGGHGGQRLRGSAETGMGALEGSRQGRYLNLINMAVQNILIVLILDSHIIS